MWKIFSVGTNRKGEDMQTNTIVSVEYVKYQFIQVMAERIQTKDELSRFSDAVERQIRKSENPQLRDALSEIRERVEGP